MSEPDLPLRRAQERIAEAEATVAGDVSAMGLPAPTGFSDWLGAAVSLAGWAIASLPSRGRPVRTEALVRYCASLRRGHEALLSEHGIDRDRAHELRWRAIRASRQTSSPHGMFALLSLEAVGEAVQLWGNGAKDGDESALQSLVLRMAYAEGYAVALLTRLDAPR